MNKKLSIIVFDVATITMKKVFFLLLLSPFGLFAQDAELYDLRWKVTDTLVYKTVMQTEFEHSESDVQKKRFSCGQSYDGLEGNVRQNQRRICKIEIRNPALS